MALKVEAEGAIVPLEVTFPDLYPYFRFEIVAPTLSLDHHQNPFGKNLSVAGFRHNLDIGIRQHAAKSTANDGVVVNNQERNAHALSPP